ncbi:MAG: 50S ribosomal protein L14e [Candidatus Bathyarchaeota archaeon]
MSAYDIGRVCLKLKGREAGARCVIVDVIDRNYVVVAGPEVRRRRVNMSHLVPLDEAVSVQRDASDEEVAGALRQPL